MLCWVYVPVFSDTCFAIFAAVNTHSPTHRQHYCCCAHLGQPPRNAARSRLNRGTRSDGRFLMSACCEEGSTEGPGVPSAAGQTNSADTPKSPSKGLGLPARRFISPDTQLLRVTHRQSPAKARPYQVGPRDTPVSA